jgi:hypothetical protein
MVNIQLTKQNSKPEAKMVERPDIPFLQLNKNFSNYVREVL